MKTREEITSLIAHHVTAVNYIYRNTKFDGRNEHRNIRFEVSLHTHTHTINTVRESGGTTSAGGQTMIMRQGLHTTIITGQRAFNDVDFKGKSLSSEDYSSLHNL